MYNPLLVNKRIEMKINQKVKEYFNKLYLEEKKAKKPNPHNHTYKKRRTAGISPYTYFEITPINEFSHFIDCEVSPTICPMQWEDLDIDFDSIDKRHCKYCDKFVYKVDNELMAQKMKEENKCIAISHNVLEKINKNADDKYYKNLEDRLLISMLFLVYKNTYQDTFKLWQEEKLSNENILKNIINDIFTSNDINKTIQWYIKENVDIENILHKVLFNIDDKKFIMKIENIIENIG